MLQALSLWSTWAMLLGGWFAASVGFALVMGKFFRRAQGKHNRNAAPNPNEISEESERTSVVPPGFFSDFVDEPTQAFGAIEAPMHSSKIESLAPRHSGMRFKAIEAAADPARKQA